MNPAPPVIIIFLTSGNGSNFVLPVKTGASFQTPKSSKNLFCSEFMLAGAAHGIVNRSSPLRRLMINLLGGAPFVADLAAMMIGGAVSKSV